MPFGLCFRKTEGLRELVSSSSFTTRQSVGRKPLRIPEEVRGSWTPKCQGSWKTKMVWCQKESGTDCSDFHTRGHAKDPQFSNRCFHTEANSQRCKWMCKLSKLSETVTAQFGIHLPSDEVTVHLLWARQCCRQGATALRKRNSTYPHKARILVKTTVCFSWWTINKVKIPKCYVQNTMEKNKEWNGSRECVSEEGYCDLKWNFQRRFP